VNIGVDWQMGVGVGVTAEELLSVHGMGEASSRQQRPSLVTLYIGRVLSRNAGPLARFAVARHDGDPDSK